MDIPPIHFVLPLPPESLLGKFSSYSKEDINNFQKTQSLYNSGSLSQDTALMMMSAVMLKPYWNWLEEGLKKAGDNWEYRAKAKAYVKECVERVASHIKGVEV